MDVFGTTIAAGTLIIQFIGACSEFSEEARSLKARLDWDLRVLREINGYFEDRRASKADGILSDEDKALLERTSAYLNDLSGKVQKSSRKLQQKGLLASAVNRALWVTRRSDLKEMEREIRQWVDRFGVRLLGLPRDLRSIIPSMHHREEGQDEDGEDRSSSSSSSSRPAVIRSNSNLRAFLNLPGTAKEERAKAMLPGDQERQSLITAIDSLSDMVSAYPLPHGANGLILSSRRVSAHAAPGTADFDQLSAELGELASALACIDPAADIRLLQVKYYFYHPSSSQFMIAQVPPQPVRSMVSLEDMIACNPFPSPGMALGECFKLAYKLAEAVFFLHTAGFLHKNLTSSSVVVLSLPRPRGSKKPLSPSTDEAYLMGFDLIRGVESATYHEGACRRDDAPGEAPGQAPRSIWAFDIFQHPDRLQGPRAPRYIKTYDVYSLGVLLLEIGVWLPLPQIVPRLDVENPPSWPKALCAALDGLSCRMGERYRRTVEWCISLSGNRGIRDDDFVREVLDPLDDMMCALA